MHFSCLKEALQLQSWRSSSASSSVSFAFGVFWYPGFKRSFRMSLCCVQTGQSTVLHCGAFGSAYFSLSYCCLYVLIWNKTWKKAWWVYRCAWGLLAAAMKWQMERSACSGQSSSHGFLWLSFRKGKTLLVAPVYLNHLVATKDYT